MMGIYLISAIHSNFNDGDGYGEDDNIYGLLYMDDDGDNYFSGYYTAYVGVAYGDGIGYGYGNGSKGNGQGNGFCDELM